MKNSEGTKNKKPIYKRWYFWVIIVAVIGIAIGGIIGAKGNEIPENESGNDNSSIVEEPNITYYYMGDSVFVGAFEYTVTAVTDTSNIFSAGSTVTTENNFVNITVAVKNMENISKFFYSGYMTLLLGDKKYKGDYATDGLISGYNMNAGISRSFTIIFETPSKSSDDAYLLQVGMGNDTKLIALKNSES